MVLRSIIKVFMSDQDSLGSLNVVSIPQGRVEQPELRNLRALSSRRNIFVMPLKRHRSNSKKNGIEIHFCSKSQGRDSRTNLAKERPHSFNLHYHSFPSSLNHLHFVSTYPKPLMQAIAASAARLRSKSIPKVQTANEPIPPSRRSYTGIAKYVSNLL